MVFIIKKVINTILLIHQNFRFQIRYSFLSYHLNFQYQLLHHFHNYPLLLIVFVGLLIGAFILGTKFANKEDEVNKEQQYTLDIYEFTYGLCEKESSKCKKIDSIPVKTKEAKILTSYEESEDDTYYHVKHILYNDETVKLYNLETKKITETNLKAEYDEYELQMSYDSKEVLGIILYKDSSNTNDYNVYYDIKNQKKLQ